MNAVTKRAEVFLAAHPHITITAPIGHSTYWVARSDGRILAAERRLWELLADLRYLLGEVS
jgi:hypothetical protein